MADMTNPEMTSLSRDLGKLLAESCWQVTCAESCTGGGIAQAITDIPGSSAWFGAGYVTYSNNHKQKMLGVSPNTLESEGAVSEAVVVEMAEGALAAAGANLAVAVSGIAGPDGGTPAKPVGTVWFAWVSEKGRKTRCCRFDGNRVEVRRQAVIFALKGLIELCPNTV